VAVEADRPNQPPYLDDRGCGRHNEHGRVKAKAETRAKAVKLSYAASNGAAALAAPATTAVALLLRGEAKEEEMGS
jgi:hypothetical protein